VSRNAVLLVMATDASTPPAGQAKM
jgi:hypothetical protein